MPFMNSLYVLYRLVDEATNTIVMAEEQYPIVSGIGQAAVSGLAHDQVQELTVQEDYTAKETPEEVSRIRSIISYLAVLLRYCGYHLSLSTLIMFFFFLR